MNVGIFCFLDASYYKRFTDPYLMHAQEQGGRRPFFFTFQDTQHPEIYWFVPVSRVAGKMGKYQGIIAKKKQQYGKCETLVIGEVLGQQAAFLIQNMCPVTTQYITETYVQESNKVPVSVRKETQTEVERLAKIVWARIKQKAEAEIKAGKPVSKNGFVFPDIFTIYQELVKDLDTQA